MNFNALKSPRFIIITVLFLVIGILTVYFFTSTKNRDIKVINLSQLSTLEITKKNELQKFLNDWGVWKSNSIEIVLSNSEKIQKTKIKSIQLINTEDKQLGTGYGINSKEIAFTVSALENNGNISIYFNPNIDYLKTLNDTDKNKIVTAGIVNTLFSVFHPQKNTNYKDIQSTEKQFARDLMGNDPLLDLKIK